MNTAASYGNPEKMTVVKKRMDDRYITENITTICITIAVMFVVAALLTPFVFYVVKIVPEQHQQKQELMLECLAHHTVKACDQLTGKVAVE